MFHQCLFYEPREHAVSGFTKASRGGLEGFLVNLREMCVRACVRACVCVCKRDFVNHVGFRKRLL